MLLERDFLLMLMRSFDGGRNGGIIDGMRMERYQGFCKIFIFLWEDELKTELYCNFS